MSFEQLTPSEQSYAKAHYGLLISFMRKYNVDDEMYGILSERYLKVVRRYLTNRGLRRWSFSTILWMNLRSELSHEREKNARKPVILPFEEDNGPMSEDDKASMELWEILEKRLRQKELDILTMRMMGNSYREIGKAYHISRKAVNGRLYRIRKKLLGL